MTDWNHNALLRDLAEHFERQGRIVFRDQLIGPAGSPRPDVLTINKTYNRWNPAAYEVKTHRSDFLSDVTSGKWAQYYDAAASVTFAVPKGLINKAELPKKAGLIVRSENGWRHSKKPTIDHVDNFDRFLWLALLFKLSNRNSKPEPRASSFSRASRERHELGERIAKYLYDSTTAERAVVEARKHVETIMSLAKSDAEKIVNKAIEENPLVLSILQKTLADHGIGGALSSWHSVEKRTKAREEITKAASAVGLTVTGE